MSTIVNRMTTDAQPTLIIIAGPTATGKTSIAIQLAKSFSTEIISSDSRQFYQELKIGTARPSDRELSEVPHHFIGHLSIHDNYNVSLFETDAILKLEQLFLTRRIAIMAGGSGLYINAVCHGIDDLPDPDNMLREDLKVLLNKYGIAALQQKVKELDPEYYKTVDLSNPKRLLRAIEVCMTTGKPFSSLRRNEQKNRNFRIVSIGLTRDRDELFNRINTRVEKMITEGLLDEVKSVYPFKGLNALNTVGYKELFDYLDGLTSFDKAIEKIKTNSRRYAKRQLTWFNKDKEITWFHPEDVDGIYNFIGKEIRET
ncbi:MAG: tRNA (adenosine(37)-N6)-dimethylallyltransferase MiaA [Bacteroidetes bacterium]|nr:tRNA (adenosine(37)-N6)-dimethylallyltransferase MiaA [Bacteroidota bacterium]